MNKFFCILGSITLVILSFIYTEKTVNVIKEYDDIMISIKSENENYKIDAVDATIKDNTIIPGLKGREIDENKSYSKMKRYGSYNSSLLEYNDIIPSISIENNFDKYIISGNKSKNMVSLIFLVTKDYNIDNIIKVLDTKNIKGNFFIDGTWAQNNEQKLIEIIQNGHNVGNLGTNGTYNDSTYSWLDTIIKKIAKQEIGYCYNEVDDITALKLCAMYKNYTIRPNIIVKNYPLTEVKKNIQSGSIISFRLTDTLEKELPLIINYIQSKGFTINTLNEHLSE